MRAAVAVRAGKRWATTSRRVAARSQIGSAAAEIVILTPLLVVLALLFAAGGRLANTLQEVGDAARTSVESAVIAATASGAEAQAAAAAGYEISHDGLKCAALLGDDRRERLCAGRSRLGSAPLRRRARRPRTTGCSRARHLDPYTFRGYRAL